MAEIFYSRETRARALLFALCRMCIVYTVFVWKMFASRINGNLSPYLVWFTQTYTHCSTVKGCVFTRMRKHRVFHMNHHHSLNIRIKPTNNEHMRWKFRNKLIFLFDIFLDEIDSPTDQIQNREKHTRNKLEKYNRTVYVRCRAAKERISIDVHSNKLERTQQNKKNVSSTHRNSMMIE